jgi:hypothetical protein
MARLPGTAGAHAKHYTRPFAGLAPRPRSEHTDPLPRDLPLISLAALNRSSPSANHRLCFSLPCMRRMGERRPTVVERVACLAACLLACFDGYFRSRSRQARRRGTGHTVHTILPREMGVERERNENRHRSGPQPTHVPSFGGSRRVTNHLYLLTSMLGKAAWPRAVVQARDGGIGIVRKRGVCTYTVLRADGHTKARKRTHPLHRRTPTHAPTHELFNVCTVLVVQPGREV